MPRLAASGLRSPLSSTKSAGAGIAPRTRFNADVSASRVWDSVTLELAAVKQIKSVVPGATVNDAVIAMIGGAMRRYLLDKKELPAKSLVTLAPVNTREKGAQRDASGNTISVVRFPLCTDIEDPIERLVAVHAATAESKAMQRDRRARPDRRAEVHPAGDAGPGGPAVDAARRRRQGSAAAAQLPGDQRRGRPSRCTCWAPNSCTGWGRAGDRRHVADLEPDQLPREDVHLADERPQHRSRSEFLARCLRESFEEMKAAAAAVAVHAPPVEKPPVKKPPAKKGPAKARKTAPARAWRA
ncbi:MAG: WS/DGAT domain-containing protein [Rubrivivax sp.]